jgi:hypothetical protein
MKRSQDQDKKSLDQRSQGQGQAQRSQDQDQRSQDQDQRSQGQARRSLTDQAREIIEETKAGVSLLNPKFGTLLSFFKRNLMTNLTTEVHEKKKFQDIIVSQRKYLHSVSASGLSIDRDILCQDLEGIFDRTRDAGVIGYCREILDTVERCALGFYSMDKDQHPQEELLSMAFNARIKFYNRFFVETGAKHASRDPTLLHVCDYLRYTRAHEGTRRVAARTNMQVMEQMLSTVNAREIWMGKNTPPVYSFDDDYKLKSDQMPSLAKQLYKAIQGTQMKA